MNYTFNESIINYFCYIKNNNISIMNKSKKYSNNYKDDEENRLLYDGGEADAAAEEPAAEEPAPADAKSNKS